MKKIFFALGLFVLGMANANAAFYFNLNGTGRLVLSADQQTGVLLQNGKPVMRLELGLVKRDQIDNQGRPFILSGYSSEECKGNKNSCIPHMVGVKNYMDKAGGLDVWLTDGSGNVVWTLNITSDKLTSD